MFAEFLVCLSYFVWVKRRDRQNMYIYGQMSMEHAYARATLEHVYTLTLASTPTPLPPEKSCVSFDPITLHILHFLSPPSDGLRLFNLLKQVREKEGMERQISVWSIEPGPSD